VMMATIDAHPLHSYPPNTGFSAHAPAQRGWSSDFVPLHGHEVGEGVSRTLSHARKNMVLPPSAVHSS
jgi:hypothetical protein